MISRTILVWPASEPPSRRWGRTRPRTGAIWKRELHASDLFRRGGNTAEESPPPGAAPDKPAAGSAEPSIWKRELRASDLFRWREKAPTVPGDAFSDDDAESASSGREKSISATCSGGSRPEPADLQQIEAPADGAGAPKPAPFWKRGIRRPKRQRGRLSFRPGRTPKVGGADPIAVPLMRAVNLLPPELETTKERRIKPADVGVAIAVIAALAVLLMNARSDFDTQTQAKERVEQALEAARAPIPGLEGPIGAGDALLRSEQSARATALSDAISRRTSWDRMMREVAVVMPADAWLTTFAGSSSVDAGISGLAEGNEVLSTLTGFSLSREGVAKPDHPARDGPRHRIRAAAGCYQRPGCR